MVCERSNALNLRLDLGRRTGLGLECALEHCDPVEERGLRLFPNSPRKARVWLVTLYRSLVWLFTPQLGGGARSAASLLAGIGNIDGFESADKLAAYVGIVPKVSQPNETDNRGRITRRGNKLMRTALVQCTLVAKRYSGYLNAFSQRIKEHRGAGKAIIATARKLLSIICDTLKNGWVFEDFTEFKIKQNQCPAGQAS